MLSGQRLKQTSLEKQKGERREVNWNIFCFVIDVPIDGGSITGGILVHKQGLD